MIRGEVGGRTMPVRGLVAGLVAAILVGHGRPLEPRYQSGHGPLGAAEVASQGRLAAGGPAAIPGRCPSPAASSTRGAARPGRLVR